MISIKKLLLGLLYFVLGILVFVLLFGPGIARNYFEKHSKEWVGRKVQVDKVRLNYLTGLIQLMDVSMFEADDQEVFLGFDTLQIDWEPYRLFSGVLKMEELLLSGFHAKLVKYDSTFNFDELLAFHSSDTNDSGSDSLTTEEGNMELIFENIRIRNTDLLYLDQNSGEKLSMKDLSLYIPYLALNQDQKTEAGLRFYFENNGYLDTRSFISPKSGDFELDVNIHNMDLAPYSLFVRNQLNGLSAIEGTVFNQMKLTGNVNDQSDLLLMGALQIKNFKLRDDKMQQLSGFHELRLSLDTLNLMHNRVVIDSLVLDQPYTFFELWDSTSNFQQLAELNRPVDTLQKNLQEQPAGDTTHSLFFVLNHFSIHDGSFDYRDHRTGEPFDYHLSQMELTADSLKSSAPWIDLYAKMLLNERGKLKAELGLDPNNPYEMSLDLVIEEFELSDLNIYANHYLGNHIVSGDMYYKSNTKIHNGIIESKNKLLIDQARVDDAAGGLYELPLKFALFILKDKNGLVDIDLPVEGDLNNPDLSIGKLLWDTFKGFIGKVAAAPGKMLAGLVGADPDQLEKIEFDYTDTILNNSKQKQLELLVELERKKEGIAIELEYFVDEDKQKETLAIQQAGLKYNKRDPQAFQKQASEFERFLRRKTRSDTMTVKSMSMKLIDSEKLEELNRSHNQGRFDQIQAYLLQISDSSRINLIQSDSLDPANILSLPVFRVNYTLEQD